MERERVLAFRASRQGLTELRAQTLAQAAACPASDFQRGSGLVAVAARTTAVTRERFDTAVDAGELAVAHTLRGALHVLAAGDIALYGRALVADEPAELLDQLGENVTRQLRQASIDPRHALAEVTEAAAGALEERGPLDRNELHEELRARVRSELLPWCPGCQSHHVAPMLWRYALANLDARRDNSRRYVLGRVGSSPQPVEAVRRFMSFYGPTTADEFGAWAGVGRRHARRLWQEVEAELLPMQLNGGTAWLLADDAGELESPPRSIGLRLLPPGDPFLQRPNRAVLVPDAQLRKRVFRPVGSPGVVLHDGGMAGLWRARSSGKRLQIDVEQLAPIERDALEAQAERIAELRDAPNLRLEVAD